MRKQGCTISEGVKHTMLAIQVNTFKLPGCCYVCVFNVDFLFLLVLLKNGDERYVRQLFMLRKISKERLDAAHEYLGMEPLPVVVCSSMPFFFPFVLHSLAVCVS